MKVLTRQLIREMPSVARLVAAMGVSVLLGLLAAGPASATPVLGVMWKVTVVAQPTNLVVSAHKGKEATDQYAIVLTNVGGAPSSGEVTLTDTLPEGVTVPVDLKTVEEHGWSCTVNEATTIVTCIYPETVPALGQAGALTIPIAVAKTGLLTNRLSVSSPGAPVAIAERTSQATASSLTPAFELIDFASQSTDATGTPATQAAGHPFAITTSLDFPEIESGTGPELAVQHPKAIEVELPAGLVGNPQAATKCTLVALLAEQCPPSSRIGSSFVNLGQGLFAQGIEGQSPAFQVFNIVPEHGFPAEFGFYAAKIKKLAILYATVGPAPDYRIRVTAPDVPESVSIAGLIATFFGDPQTIDETGGVPVPFLTNPSDCSGRPLVTDVRADSWEEPEHWVHAQATSPPVAGCSQLHFHPTLSFTPETTTADEPSGATVELKVPQTPTSGLEGTATPPVKNTTVTLPQGVSLSPASAEGLASCPAEGPEGFNLYASGPGHCPLASQIGDAEATTPLLEEPLKGHLYVAQPACGGAGQPECGEADALDGKLFSLYLELDGSGLAIKLRGTTSVNPATGQVTATFKDSPQQPFSDLKLKLKGGPRAPLATPQACGQALGSADITPWSSPETPDATSILALNVTGCEGSPFAPSFLAGTTSAAAGAYTNFTTTFGRSDRSQDLAAIQVQTPPGLLGMLSHVTLCREPQAAQGTCSPASRIGTATTATGPGPHPFWVSGPVYLTGPYNGAPFGLSVAIPAVAGPFNLGTVVVRAAINVDPHTSALTITSDPLPQIIDGVPLRIQTVNVTVDRPQFMFNPTNCEGQQITARIASAQGTVANVATPFAAAGCTRLPFKPSFKVSTQGNGTFTGGAKGHGASLDVKITQAPGEAAIGKVDTQLPLALPSRLTTLQKACTDTQFAANPAGCPEGSLVGAARAITPVLNTPLTGPAYLVSHGGAAFPDLVIVLQGEGIRIDLTGNTNIKKGITYSRFETVPDAPISSFELSLPEGPHSVLAAARNLCALTKTVTVRSHGKRIKRTVATPLLMPTTISGQNGAVVQHATVIHVTGCVKAKGAKKAKKARRARPR
jgi:hypothetical protein